VQRRHADVALGIDISMVGQQQLRHFLVVRRFPQVSSPNHQQVQWRIAVLVPGINVGLAGQQEFRHLLRAKKRRVMQRRRAVIRVLAENQTRILFEQGLDLFQVVVADRLM